MKLEGQALEMRRLPARRRVTKYRVIRTKGEAFPDGTILEPITNDSQTEPLQLILWNGSEATVGKRFKIGEKIYAAAHIDPSIRRAIYFPGHARTSPSPGDLDCELKKLISRYNYVPEKQLVLLTRFILSTWFASNFLTAPWLAICGSDCTAGIQLLRLLNCLCRRAIRIIEPSVATVSNLPRGWGFTLLVQTPQISCQVQRLIEAVRPRESFLPRRGRLLQMYSPIVTLTDGPWPLNPRMQSAVEISAMPSRSPRERLSQEAADQIAADFQPLLLGYYLAMQTTVKNSDVANVGLSFCVRELYENLAACTPDDHQLQTELLNAFKAQDEISRMTRWTDPDVVIIESLLSFCHEEKDCFYVGEVSETASLILTQRGGGPSLSAREVGRRIRLMQLHIEPRDRRGFRVKLTELRFAKYTSLRLTTMFQRCKVKSHGVITVARLCELPRKSGPESKAFRRVVYIVYMKSHIGGNGNEAQTHTGASG